MFIYLVLMILKKIILTFMRLTSKEVKNPIFI